jgi:chorismate synthase
MFANCFGKDLKITTFGESHGPAVGVVIDGCPSGIDFDWNLLLRELQRRRPGSNKMVSSRQEPDKPEILSGVFEGKTLGTPIAVIVKNKDARSEDYLEIKQEPRLGHADDVWKSKFGHVDHRGGGRSSGRETFARVIGGAFQQMLLKTKYPELKVTGFARRIGPIELSEEEVSRVSKQSVDEFVARFPSPEKHGLIWELLSEAKTKGLSYGGVAEIWIEGLPSGVGEPVFDKLKARLAQAMMSVGATCGFELGAGFAAALAEGSDFHRPNHPDQNRYGGIRGGISTGEKIVFRVAFKPTSSVMDIAKKGRHDPCIVPRAIPVLEAMTYLCL